MKGKNLYISTLLDFYGDILTDRQREAIDFYYNKDLSLAEIAEQYSISRQGVRDSIKRGEAQLLNMEERLGLVAHFRDVHSGLDTIIRAAKELELMNSRQFNSSELLEKIQLIRETAEELSN